MLEVEFTPKEYRRFFKNIILDKKTGCWNWIGAKDHQGYGQGFYRHRRERVHRVIYALLKSPIPRGDGRSLAQLDHLCDNTSCCNPEHLELVTQQINGLRGNGLQAENAKKTHCKHGHPLPKYEIGKPRGYCKICDSIRHKKRMNGPKRKYWLKKASEAQARYRIKHS